MASRQTMRAQLLYRQGGIHRVRRERIKIGFETMLRSIVVTVTIGMWTFTVKYRLVQQFNPKTD